MKTDPPRFECVAEHPSLCIRCHRWDGHPGKHQVTVINAMTSEISLREWETSVPLPPLEEQPRDETLR